MKLFQNYFFSYWRESARETIKTSDQPIINCEQLYFRINASGFVDQPNNQEIHEAENGLMSAMEDFS